MVVTRDTEPMVFANATISADDSMTVDLSVTWKLTERDKRLGFAAQLMAISDMLREEVTASPMVAVTRELLRWKEKHGAPVSNAIPPPKKDTRW